VPIRGPLSVQAELLCSRKRHPVDLESYEPIAVTFT
jgi:hypothetical protein